MTNPSLFRRLALAACLVAGLVTADEQGNTASPEAQATSLRLEPYLFEARDGTRVDAELGTFTVPENRRRPDSRMIELKFVRFKSTAPEPGSPIVYLAGGPGGSGTGAASRFPLFMAFREVADVIAFDQRGTGMSGSEELDCGERFQLPLGQPGDPAKMLAGGRGAVIACVQAMREKGVDLAGYNSVESADDLDALRGALGAEKITLWGISYGTHLALATLRRHGAHVDRVILAGLEGPDQSYKLPSNVQALMEEIGRMAKADAAVRAKVPDLLAALGEVLEKLRRQPVTVEVTDPRSGEKVKVALSAFDVQMTISNMLRGPETFAILPETVFKLTRGDFSEIAQAAGPFRVGAVGSAMSAAMDCASGATATRLERIAAEAPQAPGCPAVLSAP